MGDRGINRFENDPRDLALLDEDAAPPPEGVKERFLLGRSISIYRNGRHNKRSFVVIRPGRKFGYFLAGPGHY